MSEEGEDDFDIALAARNFQRAMHEVPRQAKIVSDMTQREAGKVSREVAKVKVSRKLKVIKPMTPMKIPKTMPRPNTSFSAFVGRRRRIKNPMDILTGR